MSSSRRQGSPELPCLALHRRDHSTALFSTADQKPIVSGDVEELLRNKTVCPTARGLLLVRDPASLATFLWNPQDGDQLHLPPLEGVDDTVLMHSHCLLSGEPSTPGCVVLLVEPFDETVIWYCHTGGDRWVKHDYDIGTMTLPHPDGDQRQKITICPIAACRGKFYFNSLSTEMGVLEFCPDPVFSSIAVDDTISESDGSEDDEGYEGDDYGYDDGDSVFLVESGGELYRVTLFYVTHRGDEIDDGVVDKFDFSELRWRGVDDLGGRTFVLSLCHFGASCSGGEGGLRQDCIYIVYPRKKEMQVFDVKEGTNELLKLDEAPTSDKAFWFLPADPYEVTE
ncbi:hypothetical protein ACP70R_038830 [Stipagrostis hirtigluma subsp. patula]